ncbi:hypothetical protein [Massilia aerilata]|uniref:Uncharacterized protein n=1 Tax=Massilia aerilata TaxID=453817 RepID=A0ABW0S1V9_9BURK
MDLATSATEEHESLQQTEHAVNLLPMFSPLSELVGEVKRGRAQAHFGNAFPDVVTLLTHDFLTALSFDGPEVPNATFVRVDAAHRIVIRAGDGDGVCSVPFNAIVHTHPNYFCHGLFLYLLFFDCDLGGRNGAGYRQVVALTEITLQKAIFAHLPHDLADRQCSALWRAEHIARKGQVRHAGRELSNSN